MTRTISKGTYNQKPSKPFYYDKIANGKIDFATAGLHQFIYKDLTQNVSSENAQIQNHIAIHILFNTTRNQDGTIIHVTSILHTKNPTAVGTHSYDYHIVIIGHCNKLAVVSRIVHRSLTISNFC
jgi:hypothetical protein